ncbi:elongation factor G, partial [candidate division WOR-1 bacterium DG_54_3]
MPRRFSLDKVRNIGLMAHIDAGKTTTTERILYYTGKTHRMGEVDDGAATMDWMKQEKERGITITSAATTCYWRNHQINIIDTPGHVDFTDHVPRIAFVNKMDRVGCDFENAVTMMRKRLGANAVPIQFPATEGDKFSGIIDLVNMQYRVYHEESLGATFDDLPIPEEFVPEAKKKREELLESLTFYDDKLLEKFLSEEPIDEDEIKFALRKATLDTKIFPVLCGSALKNKGIQ